MSKLMQNKSIAFIFGVLWTTLLLWLIKMSPLMSVFVVPFVPSVLAVYTAKGGTKQGVLFALTVSALCGLLLGGRNIVLLSIWSGVSGVSLGLMFLRKTRTKKLVVFTSFMYLLLFIGTICFYNWSYQTNLMEHLFELLKRVTEQSTYLLKEQIKASDYPQMAEELDAVIKTIKTYPSHLNDNFPSYAMIAAMLFGYLYFVFTKWLMRLGHIDVSFVRPFSEYRLPKSVMVFLAVLMICGLFTSKYFSLMVHYNLMNVLLFLLGISGLAFLDWWLVRHKVPLIVRLILFVGLIFVRMILPIIDIFQILVLLGMLDTFIDYRHKKGVRSQ